MISAYTKTTLSLCKKNIFRSLKRPSYYLQVLISFRSPIKAQSCWKPCIYKLQINFPTQETWLNHL